MQIVTHPDGYKNVHKVFDEIEQFYKEYSTFEQESKLVHNVYDSSFRDLENTFSQYSNMSHKIYYVDRNYAKLDLPKYDEKNIIICFSGGKDSIALALKCKEQGYNVYLYSVKHINPSFHDETKIAEEAARVLGVPIYIDDITLKGHHDWMEHPMKNMIIANGALNYGIKNGIGTRVWFGNYTTSFLEDNDFTRCAGDCIDMWDSYNTIINTIIPGFHIEFGLETMGETLELITPHRDILDLSLSCLCRHSLRPYRWNWVKEKFGIELPKHRCGSCYKCCVEYIYMADHDLIEFSKDYYKYCINQLYRVQLNEHGPAFELSTVWYNYLFYPIEESKIYNDIMEARLFIRSVKWKNEKIVKSK